MKKTIFKGTINGKNFDSVQAYNEEMMRAIAAGESVQANSETSTIDTDDQKDEDSYELPCPGFEPEDEYYLDKYVTGDNDKDAILYYNASEYVHKSLAEIIDKLGSASDEDLNLYKEYVISIADTINDDRIDNTRAIESINEKINSLKEQIREEEAQKAVCVNSIQIMELFDKVYSDIYNRVDKELKSRDKRECVCCECKDCKCSGEDSCKCKEESNVNIQKSIEETVKKLIKEIFE